MPAFSYFIVMQFRQYIALVALFLSQLVYAQVKLPVPLNIAAAYNQQTRSPDGSPGKNYWQNTADYTIKVDFDPSTRLLKGTMAIRYINNSPDTLHEVWFKLYPNLYKKDSPRETKVSASDFTDGVAIQQFVMNNKALDVSRLNIDGTNMIVPAEILSRQTTHFQIAWSYTLNKGSHVRTGQVDTGAFFIAYFFPRIAVYDDIDGWNENPYLGSAEFYNDFCSFNVEISVPKDYAVWATGDLDNAADVLQPGIYKRVQQAGQSDSVVNVITEADLQQSAVTTGASPWKFTASNVTDFAFAISNHYVWKAGSLVVDKQSGRRTRVDVVFNPRHNDYNEVVNYARKTVEVMSYTFPKWPFPYPHETIFDGLDQMEYPMMVNDNPLADKEATITLTDHEIFHTMFPFYMGVNETKYGWMDEGWATIGEWLISPCIDPAIVDDYGVKPYEKNAGSERDLPIMTLTTQQKDPAFYLNSYPKPAFGYLYVKDMLGDELFTKALHYYIRQWNGKHPMPYDFFNCMNTGAGQNMNWFWKRWFFDNGFPDLAIRNVKKAGSQYTVIIESVGGKPVPIDVTVYFSDQTVQKIHRSIACWKAGNKQVTIEFSSDKKVDKVVLGSTYVPDVNKRDNVYKVRL
ncbi:M1 family metallopeptidase [Pedobacter sp. BS3]|uniref:M1 family metallopeptidase n=1 Tax=Pedobacter sp. BS3 TaxID=2567937 RepID=UPI001F5B339A|nr:M1 family metallopeptidase [Pedobacter sp. BS3]